MSHNNIYDEESRSSLEGKILVASPYLDDPYFNKALVYICAHDSSGAIGIMLNQNIGVISCEDIPFSKGEHKISKDKSPKRFPLIFGGPVNTDMLIALSLSKKKGEQEIILHTDVSIIFNEIIQDSKKVNKSKFVVAKGVSAWDSDQLEEEIAEGSWFVTEHSPDIIFSQRITDKWDVVIKEMAITPHKLVQYSGRG